MPVARPEPAEVRVIAHVDLDCFYVQVEQRKRPDLRGKPTGVVQYNPWKGGGLIAVGYEARKFGVTRNMRGDEAKKVCPDIELIQVPVAHGKADLTQYRDAGSEVVAVLSRKGTCERASIDEVYLDITEASAAMSFQESFSDEVLKSHILGLSEAAEELSATVEDWLLKSISDPKDRMLGSGAVIIADLRRAVFAETGFTCSAGIAHNKMLAKLASGMHKPAQQTLVPSTSVTTLLAALPIKKMKQLGGKLGDSLKNDLHISFVGDLLQFSESRLQDLYGVNTGSWLWNIARGLSGDEVKSRTLPKSHSCGKTFPGPKALKRLGDVKHWITELATELQERLEVDLQQNHRMAHLLTLHAGTNHGYKANQDHKFPSKSCVLRFGKEKVALDGFRLFERGLNDYLAQNRVSPKKGGSPWAITALFIGASNIWAIPSGVNPITHFFSLPTSPDTSSLFDKGGSASPLSSSSVSSFDAPPSPFKDVDITNETICRPLNDPTSVVVNMDSEPFIWPQGQQPKNLMAEPTKWCSSIGSPEKVFDDTNGNELAIDSVSENTGMDAQQSDIRCTPTFGEFVHVDEQTCTWQLPTSSSGQYELDLCSVNPDLNSEQKRPEASRLVIECSPVEQEVPITTAEDTYEASSNSKRPGLPSATENKVMDADVRGGFACKKETAADSRQQMSRILKLKDVWDRKLSGPPHSARPTQSRTNPHWGYKQGDIDAETLSELPEEIQEELCRSLGLKRTKKSTIGDFFRNSLSGRGNKTN